MSITAIDGLPDSSAPQTDRRRFDIRRLPLAIIAILTLAFLMIPVLIVIPMSFSGASSLEFPPTSFSLRWYEAFFSDVAWLEAARTSAIVGLVSSVGALILGTLASYGLARGRFRGRALLSANFLAPMIIPTIVTAVALYLAFAQVGMLGSLFGLILAHTILGVPYVMLVMTVAVQSLDERLEQAARTLGASWPKVIMKVILPNLAPSVVAAWLFAFITSFDEVVVTIFVAGPAITVPKKMFNELVIQVNPTITAIATMLIVLSLLTVGLFAWMLQRRNREVAAAVPVDDETAA